MPTAAIRDITTYYEEAGKGDALLLINDLGGDLQSWALQVPELAKHFRVIAFDNRGAGRSSAPDRPYSIAAMAQDAAALLDALGVESAHVLGVGMGGFIAQELAIAHPKRVQKLVLLGSAAALDGYGRTVVRTWIDARRSNMSREQVVRFTSPYLYSPGLLDDEDRYERAVLSSASNPYAQQDHAFIRQARAAIEFDARDRLGSIKQEALVIAAKDDLLFPARLTKQLASKIGGAKVLELEGGHVGYVEYPQEYNAALLEFLGTGVREPEAATA
ncbi:MAG: alpha/beta fold hydrolase [Dehalococcoidia bacterium]|nr:alpha/beta fold hydrolase [Dehalococcoidia bacterium]